MYKIYINGTPLFLTRATEFLSVAPLFEKHLLLRYSGNRKFLLNIIDQLEKTDRFEKVVVFHENFEKLWADFQSVYKLISAAGGVVLNSKNQVLMIHRLGYWDLPKGKAEEGETPSVTALREVQEETGLSQLSLGAPLADTLHTYRQNDRRILKTTHWFLMKTDQTALTPQREEGIELAVWKDLGAFLEQPEKAYGSILDTLNNAKTAIEKGGKK